MSQQIEKIHLKNSYNNLSSKRKLLQQRVAIQYLVSYYAALMTIPEAIAMALVYHCCVYTVQKKYVSFLLIIYPFSLSSSTSTCCSAFPTAKIQACKHNKHPNKSKLTRNWTKSFSYLKPLEHPLPCTLFTIVDSARHVKDYSSVQ